MKMLLFGFAACGAALLVAAAPKASTGQVAVLECTGEVASSVDGKSWKAVQPGAVLSEGTHLRTAHGANADLMLQYNGSVFRLAQDGRLQVKRLGKTDTGVGMVTETMLDVQRGSLVGSQRKLHAPSILEITTPQGRAFIRGTEYVVNAQGAVSVISGSVEVIFNLPGNQGSVKAVVSAGFSFDPATGAVVPTTPAHLQNVIADIDAVRANAQVFKAGGATIVVKPDQPMSIYQPRGNNGVGNGIDPQPPGNPPINDGPGTGPGNPGNKAR